MTATKFAVRSSRAIATALLLGSSSFAFAQAIVQPGAPGQDSKTLTAQEATQLAKAKYTDTAGVVYGGSHRSTKPLGQDG